MMRDSRLAGTCVAAILVSLFSACGGGSGLATAGGTAAAGAGVTDSSAPPMVFDGHVDMLVHLALEDYSGWRPVHSVDLGANGPGQVDLARLRRGHSAGGIYTVAALGDGDADERLRRAVGILRDVAVQHPGWRVVSGADGIDEAVASGGVAMLPGLEGSEQLGEGAPEQLVATARSAGLRAITLTWTRSNAAGDAAGATAKHDGLSAHGEALVRAMNREGLLVDLSHAADTTVRDTLAIASAPVLFSHSSARALCDSPRNLPDELLRAVALNSGIVMVSFVPYLTRDDYLRWYEAGEAEWARLRTVHQGDDEAAKAAMAAWEADNPPPLVTVEDVANHVEHIRRVAGLDHVGIGSDFDGMYSHVTGLEDAAAYPALVDTLRRRGWDEPALQKLMHGNFMRVLREVEATAHR